MTSSSEDVLLLVNHVRHKKNDGTLYVMAERIAWIMNGKDTFSISHKYLDIKLQKISPDGKAKVQLQVVLHDGSASTFHFTNPEGPEQQMKDRETVKDLLQTLLPRFKRKVNKELEEKNRILAEDPKLFQLYKDLVQSEMITPEEFWAEHLPKQQSNTAIKTQDIGVSSAFLADIKPQTDGCNGLKYNLTADIIEAIFKTYPAVKKKHIEYVPDKLSESDFWTKFFQSHYFHRDRVNTNTKDLFAECIKSDEQDIATESKAVSSDPLLDLSRFEDNSLDAEYGLAVKDNQPQGNSVNQNMIRRFNHHSMMVLKACKNSENRNSAVCEQSNENAKKAINSKKLPSVPNGLTNHRPVSSTEVTQASPSKKAKIHAKLRYEDLEAPSTSQGPALHLTRAERYLHGPTPVMSSNYVSHEELFQGVAVLHHEVGNWTPNLPQVLQSNMALTVLGELSVGGALMEGFDVDSLHQSVPSHIHQELKHMYSALSELLRHFWSCFPTTTPFLEEKVVRMCENLERFQYMKLRPFQDSLLRDHYNPYLTAHMNEMLEATFVKFNSWQAKRIAMKK